MNDFNDKLKTFVEGIQAKVNARFAKQYPNMTPPVMTTMKGKRYVRVVQTDLHTGSPNLLAGRSVHCFVDMTNGDVLKAAGWKGPAKHARGNIFNDNNGLDGVSVWGAAYLR